MSKGMRLNAQTGAIENGLVFLPKAAEWLAPHLHEMTTYPASKHDDQVGSTAQALHWIKTGRKAEPGILVCECGPPMFASAYTEVFLDLPT